MIRCAPTVPLLPWLTTDTRGQSFCKSKMIRQIRSTLKHWLRIRRCVRQNVSRCGESLFCQTARSVAEGLWSVSAHKHPNKCEIYRILCTAASVTGCSYRLRRAEDDKGYTVMSHGNVWRNRHKSSPSSRWVGVKLLVSRTRTWLFKLVLPNNTQHTQ